MRSCANEDKNVRQGATNCAAKQREEWHLQHPTPPSWARCCMACWRRERQPRPRPARDRFFNSIVCPASGPRPLPFLAQGTPPGAGALPSGLRSLALVGVPPPPLAESRCSSDSTLPRSAALSRSC
eukprot:gene13417-biopygen17027